MFKQAKKEDLKLIAIELGQVVSPEAKITDLKKLIEDSKDYKADPEFVQGIITSIIDERKQKEKLESEERDRAYELEQLRLQAATVINPPINTIQNSAGSSENEKSFEKLLKYVRALTIPVPLKQESWTLFFSTLERAFLIKKVPDDFKAEILINILGEKASNLLIYISDEDLKSYEKVKAIVLREFQPTPQVCLENFRKARRQPNETHLQFASRLTTAWEYYIKARNVNDFESLKSLIVSDKLYQSLDSETATHIGIKQGESWFPPTELGKLCDIFFASRGKSFADTNSNTQKVRNNSETYTSYHARYVPPPLRKEEKYDNKYRSTKYRDKGCFVCGQLQHVAKFCPKNFNNKRNTNQENKNHNNPSDKSKIPRENALVATVSSDYLKPEKDLTLQKLKHIDILVNGVPITAINDSGTQIMVLNERYIPNLNIEPRGKIFLTSAFGQKIEAPLICAKVALQTDNGVINPPLDIILAKTNELSVPCLIPPSIIDTLTSVSNKQLETIHPHNNNNLCSESLNSSQNYIDKNENFNTRVNTTAKGNPDDVIITREDEIMCLENKSNHQICNNTFSETHKLTCDQPTCRPIPNIKLQNKKMCDNSSLETHKLINKPQTCESLQERETKLLNQRTCFTGIINEAKHPSAPTLEDVTSQHRGSKQASSPSSQIHDSEVSLEEPQRSSEYIKLKEQQRDCDSLKTVWNDLKLKKGNFVLIEGLIYHRDKVLGEGVSQLVLPKNRREKVLELAHSSVFGSHLGQRKTKERIRYSFYWPGMSGDIVEYCKTCTGCQLRKGGRVSDRAPITAVVRPELPFEVVNIDLIGEISPASGRGHKYVLCLMDQHTRWPEAVPLRSLSAKATCDALLQIFMRTGIPNVIASDCGTNFISSLTQEFVKRIGSSPRFSVPFYPASNGLIERYNKVLKNMIHHVIREDPKNWDKQLPYLLWAYREVPNCTTGISPFRLMYGREAKGPLSILKSTWAGEVHIPLNISESAVDYLQRLKVDLEVAAERASLMAGEKQKAYEDYFNKRSSVKSFEIGEQVILLIPDSANKLYARWTGPGEVIKQCTPHSYQVRLADGKVKHVHVNKMRKFHVRVQSVGVIFEMDEEFGNICETPLTPGETNFRDEVDSRHLAEREKGELMAVLDKYSHLFTGKISIAKVAPHKIRLIPGAVRKTPYIYRIPETFKPKVEEQIRELEQLGLIEPSDAEIAYPVVCVNKRDGTMRLCLDFRALNVATQKDDFPMENIQDLINSIGQANYISTLDILKGYWEIPLEEQSRNYTSFKTHHAQYRWKVMPYGLCNAAATFQRVMNAALSEYRPFCKAYIDDIAIYSPDWKTHLKHLDLVLKKLISLAFTVNIKKCEFAKPNIKYLGHIIGSGRHQPDPEKLEAIRKIKSPTTKTHLRSLLGLFNYYRDYISNYSDLVLPLTQLTKKSVPETIPWQEEHEQSFQILKDKLVNAPKLFTPKLNMPYTIQTDASAYAVGCCLSQCDEEGKLCPIAFGSQKLTESQQRWSTIEREAYAVIFGLQKFECWIFGAPVEIITDHNPLVYITKRAPVSARLQRWALALQKYHLTIKHCPGNKLGNVDALSRLPTEDVDIK